MLVNQLGTSVDVAYSGSLPNTPDRIRIIEILKRVGLSPMGWHGEFSIRYVLPEDELDDLPMGVVMHSVRGEPFTYESLIGARLIIVFRGDQIERGVLTKLAQSGSIILAEAGSAILVSSADDHFEAWSEASDLIDLIYKYKRSMPALFESMNPSMLNVLDRDRQSVGQKKLSVFQIFSFYGRYVDDFYRRNPHLKNSSYSEQILALEKDNFCPWHWFGGKLKDRGHRAIVAVADAEILQKQWAKEFNVQWRDESWREDILRAQIEHFEPEVLYVMHPLDYDSKFIRSLPRKPPVVVAWRAAEVPDYVDWSEIDLVLSHLSVVRRVAATKGAAGATFFHPGVPTELISQLKGAAKRYDVVFCGQWSHHHIRRNVMIKALAEAADRGEFSLGLFLAAGADAQLPEVVKRLNRGAVWGGEMLQTLAAAKIVVNAEIDLAQGEAGNLRLYEAMSAGAAVLTEDHVNLSWYFDVGSEVESYRSSHEMIDKIHSLLRDDLRWREISARGRERLISKFEIGSVVDRFINIINQAWNRKHSEVPVGSLVSEAEANEFKTVLDTSLLAIEAGEFEQALKLIDSIPIRDSYIQHLHYLRALALIESNRIWESSIELERELLWTPTNEEVRDLQSRVLVEIERAGQLSRDDDYVRSDAQQIGDQITKLLSTGDARSALMASARLASQLPFLPGVNYLNSVALAANGKIEEAIAACQSEVSVVGETPEIKAWLSTLQEHL